MVDLPGYRLSGAVASFVFVLFTMKQSDDLRVSGPAHPILARVGEDALLTCQLLPKRTAVHMEVRWYRSEPGTLVFAYRDGSEVTELQMEEYRGRIEWIEDNIAEGSVALKMYNIQPSDSGQYWCRFHEGNYYGETSLLLKVAGLGSAPNIHMEGPVGTEVQLVCTAKGWFPEPQVYWKDITGEELLTVSEHHIQDEDGLFYVEATLVIRNASLETVSCFIHNHILNEEKGSVISIPEKLQTELASLKVIGPSQPILVRVGEDIQLTCSLSPKANAQSMEVRWVRSHRYPAVYVYMDGDYVDGEQMAEYRGRTALVSDAIHEGRLTLQIHNARTSDDGQYRCLFEKDGVYQEASLDLKIVGLGSSPLITMEGLKDGETQLMCTSEGWFPQPHVRWRDMEGKTIPSFSEVLTQGSHGLFHVETFLLVTNSSLVNVTCSISNPILGEEKIATFSVSEFKMTFSWKMLLLLGLLLAGAAGLIRRKSCKKVNVTLDPNIGHPELILSEGNKHVTHGHSHSQTSHRDLMASSTSRARKGSCQGGKEGLFNRRSSYFISLKT
ncbi:butyrophilin-like protein 2 isoform X2 [Equus caballus]|uniref:butyrophilin-like protein 2 isoform X2 n=1 Tax=Equus caballus TaxID=9796 RepID=UPI0038B39946